VKPHTPPCPTCGSIVVFQMRARGLISLSRLASVWLHVRPSEGGAFLFWKSSALEEIAHAKVQPSANLEFLGGRSFSFLEELRPPRNCPREGSASVNLEFLGGRRFSFLEELRPPRSCPREGSSSLNLEFLGGRSFSLLEELRPPRHCPRDGSASVNLDFLGGRSLSFLEELCPPRDSRFTLVES